MLAKAGIVAVSFATAVTLPALAARQALADDSNGGVAAGCSPRFQACFVSAFKPGRQAAAVPGQDWGSGSPSKAAATDCVDDVRDVAVPCTDPNRGTWSAADDCYYYPAKPQPPKSDPVWQGHDTGAIYVLSCPFAGGLGSHVWRPTSTAGASGPSVTPAELAARAVELLPIDGPDIRMAPPVDAVGVVGVPVWLWTPVRESTWGPSSRTASVPGLSVTATARAQRVVWDMGDGKSVTCEVPGTPFSVSDPDHASPDCGYVYSRSSAGQPGQKFTVTATTTWRIVWEGGGQSGVMLRTRSSSVRVAVGELQVLVS